MNLKTSLVDSIAKRVASSAKLQCCGSAKIRQELSAQKTAEFFNLFEQDFFINGGITKTQIKEALQKLCPGLSVNIRANYRAGCNGAVGKEFSERTVVGYNLKLPFSDYQIDFLPKEEIKTFMHEIRHLMDYAYNPKYIARANTMSAFDKFQGYASRSSKYSNFYENNIYVRDFDGMLNSTKELRTNNFKNKLHDVFADTNITSSEKIEMLQEWRHRIKTEINAFSDGIEYSEKYNIKREIDELKWGVKKLEKPDWASRLSDEEYLQLSIDSTKTVGMQGIERSKKNKIGEQYLFDAKLEEIEKMLAKAIKQERKNTERNIFLFGSSTIPEKSMKEVAGR